MICAEDEIGLGHSHEGIMVLTAETKAGTLVKDLFNIYNDTVYEIGLTPNRMDAMSHFGVAKDVCAYLSHHRNAEIRAKSPLGIEVPHSDNGFVFPVDILDPIACPRYSGINISGIKVGPSPDWLKNRLAAIGVRSINNVVDATNYILHETGQPLHAFDAEKVGGKTIAVRLANVGELFLALDGKERKLNGGETLICDGNDWPMCIAGVFGGAESGVSETTVSLFLESACFAPAYIRRASIAHGLRTDSAVRFEKGTDISNTLNVLHRAAALIMEVAGGKIDGNSIDVYPNRKTKNEVKLSFAYLRKLSGKYYPPETAIRILTALGFEILEHSEEHLKVSVPYSKPDISLPADIVEEIVRIDGLDNIEMPTSMTIARSPNPFAQKEAVKEKLASALVGLGFNETMTNSITNSKYYDETVLATSVKLLNNLSADLDVMRPSMLETGLESIAYNLNRKQNDLRFFEFGKVYSTTGPGLYDETEHLALFVTGVDRPASWAQKERPVGFFDVKGIVDALFALNGLGIPVYKPTGATDALGFGTSDRTLGNLLQVPKETLRKFDIKQDVFFIDIMLGQLLAAVAANKVLYKEVPKFPAVQRDLSMVVGKELAYWDFEKAIKDAKQTKLVGFRLFDVYEGENLGGKKSMAFNFTYLDEEKTLTDKEIDEMMGKVAKTLEENLGAEIRK